MTQTIYVRFSYENKVSEEIPIQTQLDLSKNSNRTKLLNRLLNSVPEGTEVSLPKMNNVLYKSPLNK
jgi:hypothetical protein